MLLVNEIHPTIITHTLFAGQALRDTANQQEVLEIVVAQSVPELSLNLLSCLLLLGVFLILGKKLKS